MFQAGPVPKKSISGASMVVSPSNAIVRRVDRSFCGVRSGVAMRSSRISPPPGGAATVVTEAWPGSNRGRLDRHRAVARARRGAGGPSRRTVATRPIVGAARASSAAE